MGLLLRWMRCHAFAGSASAHGGSGPSFPIVTRMVSSSTSSQVVAPRSAYDVGVSSRTRTWPTGVGAGPWATRKPPIQPEVDVQHLIVVKPHEEVLSGGLGRFHAMTVELCRVLREPPCGLVTRTIWPAKASSRSRARRNRVATLRHGRALVRTRRRRDRRPARPVSRGWPRSG